MSETRERRVHALRKLMGDYQQTSGDYDPDSEEDVRPYLDGEGEPSQFCAVTTHGSKAFFYPVYDDKESAKARAVEFIVDDLYGELPAAVVDLDTDETFVPDWDALKWKLDD